MKGKGKYKPLWEIESKKYKTLYSYQKQYNKVLCASRTKDFRHVKRE